jgi:hypothetical protein
MSIFINEKEFQDNHIFRVAIEPEFKMLSSIAKNVNKREIHMLSVNQIQHGMILIHNGSEERIKTIYVFPQEQRRQFYFMHIYKTSGLSINREILDRFRHKQVYSNFVGLVDDSQMLTSSLITGHFASYPIDLFFKHGVQLDSFTLVRDPIDRCISHYLYEHKLSNPESSPSVDGFINFIESNIDTISNLQSKNITSTMDKDLGNYVYRSLDSGKLKLIDAFESLGNTSRFLSKHTNESKWANNIGKFRLIGTMQNRDSFISKLFGILDSEGYPGSPPVNAFINKNFDSTEDFKKTLPDSLISKLKDINEHDINLYDNLMSRGL